MPQRFLKLFTGWGQVMERITDFFALFGVLTWLSPAVLEWVANISTLAALLMPIFGCVWLAVQIWSRIFKGK